MWEGDMHKIKNNKDHFTFFFFQNKGYPFFKLNTFKLTFTIFIFVLSYQSREKERAELNEVTNP